MADTPNPTASQEELTNWVREQFQKANKHLAENGVLFDTVVTQESRYMAPLLAVWKIKDTQGRFYWVIAGDLPTDFVAAKVADSARKAMAHFSLSWQMKAEEINRNPNADETQQKFAELLISRAEGLYDMHADDKLWQNEPA